jgi:hypothetical protein
MAVAVNAVGTQATIGVATSVNYTGLTVGAGANRALIMVIGGRVGAMTVTACNWDSTGTPQAMDLLATVTGGTDIKFYKIYGLVNPTSGNKTLAVAWNEATNEGVINALDFTGVNQTGGATSFPGAATAAATGDPGSVSVSGGLPTNGAAVCIGGAGDANAITSLTGTTILDYSGLGSIESAARYSTATATFSLDLAGSDNYQLAAVGVAEVGAGASTTPAKMDTYRRRRMT